MSKIASQPQPRSGADRALRLQNVCQDSYAACASYDRDGYERTIQRLGASQSDALLDRAERMKHDQRRFGSHANAWTLPTVGACLAGVCTLMLSFACPPFFMVSVPVCALAAFGIYHIASLQDRSDENRNARRSLLDSFAGK